MADKFDTARGPAYGGFAYPLRLLRESFAPTRRTAATLHTRPEVRRVGFGEVREALRRGFADYAAHRTDVMFLCLVYPALGLILFRAVIGYDVLPLLFPLAAGFALLGPLAGTGLYEMSRRRADGEAVSWRTAFRVLGAPGFGAVVVLGLLFAALFVIWLQTALAIYEVFLGRSVPPSIGAFLSGVLTTRAGWLMMIEGDLVGLLFAIVAFAVGAVSFPMLIDGRFGSSTAERLSLGVSTSLRAVALNPGPMAAWGLIVAAGLIVGSVPVFLGLVVVLPVLGHTTWHLYRALVVTA